MSQRHVKNHGQMLQLSYRQTGRVTVWRNGPDLAANSHSETMQSIDMQPAAQKRHDVSNVSLNVLKRLEFDTPTPYVWLPIVK
jgi:hypothetical protein